MQTQWHIKIDCDWQTITHEITPRVRVIVDLSHAIRTIAKDGQAIISLCITCFALGYAVGSKRNDKK